MKLKEITLYQAKELAMKTDYACFVHEPEGAEVNQHDAAAFFLEGYDYARKLANDEENDCSGLAQKYRHSRTLKNGVEEKYTHIVNGMCGCGEGYEMVINSSVTARTDGIRYARKDCEDHGCSIKCRSCLMPIDSSFKAKWR